MMTETKNITIVHPISDYKQVNTKKGVSQYARHLSNQGYRVELIVYQDEQQESVNLEGVEICSISASGIGKILAVIPILLFSQSTVFMTQFIGKKDLVWAPICWIRGIKYLIVADYTPHKKETPRGIYYKTKFKLCILSIFNPVFFVRTAGSRDELSSICARVESKLRILPSGVDNAYFEIENKISGSNTLVYIGRLIEDKNVEVLIEAFNNVKDDYSLWELHIAGTGPKEYNMDDEERIVFRGFLQEEELLDLYAQADVLCLPSLHESFSNVLIEAAATETAVISTKVGIAPELLEDAGLFIKKNDVEDTEDKLRKYMQDYEKIEKDAKKLREKAEEFRHSKLVSDIEKEMG